MRSCRLGAGALVAALLLHGAVASAQSDEDRAGARAAATEATRAMDEGRYKDAVDLFARAESLVHAPPHLLYMARACAKLGRLVCAQESYLKAARETLAPNAPRAFATAQAEANAEVDAIAERIPTVKIEVEGNPPDVVITMDGVEVPKALKGIPHPVDPGEHVFAATAKGMSSDPVTRTIAERARVSVSLVLKSVGAPAVVAPVPPLTQDADATKAAKPRADTPRDGSGLRYGAYTAWGVGAVGLVLGTVFLIQNRSARDDADALCPTGACPQSKRAQVESKDSDADSAQTKAWIGYGVGIAGLATGAILFLMSKQAPKAPSGSGFRVHPAVGPGSAGVWGTF